MTNVDTAWLKRGIIVAAADHSDATLLRYATEADVDADPQRLRRIVALCANAAGADGVVVRPADVEWARKRCPNLHVVVGFPDALSGDELMRSIRAAVAKPYLAKLPAKIGFEISGQHFMSSLSAACSTGSTHGDLALVAEPYFSASLATKDRCTILRALSSLKCVVALKLDVEAPVDTAVLYSRSSGRIPWYARSEGLDYATFYARVAIAKRFGCAGVVAGAALWRSEMATCAVGLNPELISVMRRRIDQLRQLWRNEPFA